MKHISESIIGRKGTPQFLPKNIIQIGDILVQRNGQCWYLQDDMILVSYSETFIDMNKHIENFLISYDDMLRDTLGSKTCDIVSIYRSGNSIRNPDYKKIENFIKHATPIWRARD